MLAFSFDALYSAVGWLLALLYVPLHNLGLSIIVLTVIVMAVQMPLIAKQTRSMIQMQRVQPEIKRIQQKYKDDRQKQNEELLKFYQENQINPLAGCLPLLLILPIGIAVLGTFRRGIQNHIPQSGPLNKLYVELCSVGGKVLPTSAPPGPKGVGPATCSEYINGYTRLGVHHAGHTPAAMHFLGMKLNLSAAQAMKDGVVSAIPYLILLALVIGTGWYQVRQTQARQVKQGGPQPNAQMQAVTKVMPIFFGLISYGFNAATTVYFVVSNFWRIGQQHFLLNKMYEQEHARGADKKAEPKADGNGDAGKRPPTGSPPNSGGASSAGGSSTNGGGGQQRPAGSGARRKKKRKR